jgi:hypothetical protein
MIGFEMTEEEARTVQGVIEHYLYHLQTESYTQTEGSFGTVETAGEVPSRNH